MVCSSLWGQQSHLVPFLLLPLPDPSNSEYYSHTQTLPVNTPCFICAIHRNVWFYGFCLHPITPFKSLWGHYIYKHKLSVDTNTCVCWFLCLQQTREYVNWLGVCKLTRLHVSTWLKGKRKSCINLSHCLFCHQCFHVPYSALTMFISSDQKERDSATAYSEYHNLHVKGLFSQRTSSQ